MKRLLACVLPAVLVAAGCGGDTCTSQEATPTNTRAPTCSLTPGTTATIDVSICAKCTDTNASAQCEFVNGELEVAPTVQQCAAEAGCGISGCATPAAVATCTVAVPQQTGEIPLRLSGAPVGTFTFGSGASCAL